MSKKTAGYLITLLFKSKILSQEHAIEFLNIYQYEKKIGEKSWPLSPTYDPTYLANYQVCVESYLRSLLGNIEEESTNQFFIKLAEDFLEERKDKSLGYNYMGFIEPMEIKDLEKSLKQDKVIKSRRGDKD